MSLTVAPGASSALVQMAQREASTRARVDAGDERAMPLWQEALAAVAAFPAQSAADVALKLRTALAWEGDIRQTAENGDNSARAIVAALADLDRLAKGGA